MRPIQFQLLNCNVEIVTESPDVRQALAYLVQDAVHPFPPSNTLRYDVLEEHSGAFNIVESGEVLGSGLSAMRVMETIYTHCHEIAHRCFPKHMRLHAGSVTIHGKHVAFVGRKGSGKTTLMLQMVFDGMDVHGDELLLIMEDGKSLAFPRRFHVKQSAFEMMSDLCLVQDKLPFALLPDGGKLYGFAPTNVGRPWSLDFAPLDIVFFLRPNHGGTTTVTSIAKDEAIRRVRKQITFPERSPVWAASFMGIVAGVKFFILSNGDPRSSVDLVKQVCVKG